MTLRFPEVADLPLKNSPLTEVICQVRFPPILRLVERPPIDFQDRIRHRFPGFEEEYGIILKFERELGRPTMGAEMAARVYQFKTADNSSSVALTTEFYALTTEKYTVWPAFADDLAYIHDALMATMAPTYATRIGLRYVNSIKPLPLHHQERPGFESLLRPELISLLRTDAWTMPIELSNSVVLADDDGRMILRVGYSPQSKEELLLDIDYFEEGQLSLDDVERRCSRYHDVIYRAFRWCVTDNAMAMFQQD